MSGGIDSTYCLWQYLKKNPKKTLLVHHVRLDSPRIEQEAKAVMDVLDWCRRQGLKNFVYEESGFSKGTVKRDLDVYVVMFMTGLILKGRKYKQLKEILIPTPKDEYERLSPVSLSRNQRRAQRIRRALIEGDDVVVKICDDVKEVRPIKDKYKIELIEEMPKDLFELTWWCRWPDDKGEPCKKCHTCKQVYSALGRLCRSEEAARRK